MQNAMMHFFLSVAAVVCTLHLKKIQRKMDAITSKKAWMRKAVIRGIFGPNGLTSCNDVISFEEVLTKFRSCPMHQLNFRPTLNTCWSTTFVRMWQPVVTRRHTIKRNLLAASRKPSQLQELIGQLKECVICLRLDANWVLMRTWKVQAETRLCCTSPSTFGVT